MIDKCELLKYGTKQFKIKCIRYEIGSKALHWHDYYEIEFVVSGKGKHIINGEEYEWKPGEIHLIGLNDYHEIKIEGISLVYKIQIQACAISEVILDKISTSLDPMVTYLPKKEFAYMNMLCIMLEDNIKEQKFNEPLVDNILNTILCMFFDNLPQKRSINISNDKLIRDIIIYINKNFRYDMDLDKIAKEFFISKSHLCYYFKKNLGITVLDYIKSNRLEYAAKLSVTTNLKSIQICEKCGYGSLSNFLRDFKNRYGITPIEMRKQ